MRPSCARPVDEVIDLLAAGFCNRLKADVERPV
jgi:hypothetical protein